MSVLGWSGGDSSHWPNGAGVGFTIYKIFEGPCDLRHTKEALRVRKCPECKFTKALNQFRKGTQSGKCIQCHDEARQRDNRLMREAVISSLGRSCVCCGEIELVFLDIDHIDNDGARERRNTTQATWRLAFKEPERFQILCRNCNWAKHVLRFKGGCPHQRKGKDNHGTAG
jgi:hypothetical protein